MQRGGERAGLEGAISLWRTDRTYLITSASSVHGARLNCFTDNNSRGAQWRLVGDTVEKDGK